MSLTDSLPDRYHIAVFLFLGIMSSNSDQKTPSQTDGKAGQTKKSDMGTGMMAYKVKITLAHRDMHTISQQQQQKKKCTLILT